MRSLPTNKHPKFDKIRPELHPVKVQSPWHHLGIDLIGPLPVTEWDNKYILTVSDYCTKWVAAFPLTSKAATGVAISLFQVKFVALMGQKREGKGIFHVISINGLWHPQLFMTLGLPRVVTSDQGREFNDSINQELMSLLGITHRLTTAYHPQVGFYSIRIL